MTVAAAFTPSSRLAHGVVIGLVHDAEDPQNLGRVQVSFPWMSEDNRTYWARIATLMSGDARGSWFIPEVDDEVLVAFEHGDMQHPVVIGFLWNGVHKPPNSDIDRHVRRLKTVSGHVLDFDDRSGSEKVRLETQGGHVLELLDSPTPKITLTTTNQHSLVMDEGGAGTIEMKTKGGHTLTMDDAGTVTLKTTGQQKIEMTDTPAKVTIQTTGQQRVEISDAPPSVKLSTTTGNSVDVSATGITVMASSVPLTITCLQATITASSMLSVTAPMAQFSGVVQASSFIASSAVVSPVVTPAAGNTFGM
jgi:uncharacterized protein involved in type VI secretion and phage assembly